MNSGEGEATTFQLQCGCLLSLDKGTNEPCLIHAHEEITPLEAMIMVFRERLMEESPQEALVFIHRKRDELNGGTPVASLPISDAKEQWSMPMGPDPTLYSPGEEPA